MTRDDILAVMEKVPALTYFGVGLYDRGRGLSQEERDAEFKRMREQLAGSEEECSLCCEWLKDRQAIKSINSKHSSYGYKHMVEKAAKRYVSNGAFIAAAIHCGFPYRTDNSPNACFGISEKSLTSPASRRDTIWTLDQWRAFGVRCQSVWAKVNALGEIIAETPGLKAKTVDSVNSARGSLHLAMIAAVDLFTGQHPDDIGQATRIICGPSATREAKDEGLLKACQPERSMDSRGKWKRSALNPEQWATLGEEVQKIIAVVFAIGCEVRNTPGGIPVYRRFAKLHTALGRARERLDDLMYAQCPGKFGMNNPFYCSDFQAPPTFRSQV